MQRLLLLLGNACALGLLILLVSILMLRQSETDAPSSAAFVFFVTAVCLGPLGVVTMLTGWAGLVRNGNAKYGWFALRDWRFFERDRTELWTAASVDLRCSRSTHRLDGCPDAAGTKRDLHL